jgi:hypothetical protein
MDEMLKSASISYVRLVGKRGDMQNCYYLIVGQERS